MNTRDLLSNVSREGQQVPLIIEKEIPVIETLVEKTVSKMEQGGRLFYIGAGTSGRLGVLDASKCPPSFGVSDDRPYCRERCCASKAVERKAEDTEQARNDLEEYQVGEKDVLVEIAASRTTPYVIGEIKTAREKVTLTGGITCNKGSRLAEAANIPLRWW